ncbi:hypothetical protein NL108_017319 [Boleophthalmus pectinirostris]|nr:hypothetical protein NL108_017319 [Boleophthalmus pectinirostris]
MMAAKSDGVLKMKKSDVAFTPLHNSEHAGSVQGLHAGARADPGTGAGRAEGDFANGDTRCCGPRSACLRPGSEPREQRYSVWDALWVLAAVAVYVADVGTDVWLSVDYYLRRDYWWFGLTLFFVVLGSFSVQLFSFRWFVHDFSTESPAGCAADCAQLEANKLLSCSASHADVRGPQPCTPQRQASTASKNTTTGSTTTGAGSPEPRGPAYRGCVWICQSVIHILQLGQVWRYFHTIYLGVRSRRSSDSEHWRFYWRMVYEFADVSMLHLLATFLESAPQLVLQLCIIIQTHKLQPVQGMTAAASLVSLAWALASYQKSLRESREDKRSMSYLGVSLQFCWHFFTMAARVITFALFASVFQLYFGLFIVLHWCVMTFWIVHCETDYCVTKWEEIVFDMVIPVVHLLPGDPGGERGAHYAVVPVPDAALHRLVRRPRPLRHLLVLLHRRPLHAHVLRLLPPQRAALRPLAQRPGPAPGPHRALLHAAVGGRHQLSPVQPRRGSSVHPGAGEGLGDGRERRRVPGPSHRALHAVVAPAPTRRNRHKDRPLPEQVPGLGAPRPGPRHPEGHTRRGLLAHAP